MSSSTYNYSGVSGFKLRVLDTIITAIKIYIRKILLFVVLSAVVCSLWFLFIETVANSAWSTIAYFIRALISGGLDSFPPAISENIYVIISNILMILALNAIYASVVITMAFDSLSCFGSDIKNAVLNGVYRAYRVFLLNIIFSLLMIIFVVGVFYLQVILSAHLNSDLAHNGFLFGTILGVGIFVIIITWLVAIPNTVLNEMSLMRGIRYSYWLTSGNRFRIFFIVFIIGVCSEVIFRIYVNLTKSGLNNYSIVFVYGVLCMPISQIVSAVIWNDLHATKG